MPRRAAECANWTSNFFTGRVSYINGGGNGAITDGQTWAAAGDYKEDTPCTRRRAAEGGRRALVGELLPLEAPPSGVARPVTLPQSPWQRLLGQGASLNRAVRPNDVSPSLGHLPRHTPLAPASESSGGTNARGDANALVLLRCGFRNVRLHECPDA